MNDWESAVADEENREQKAPNEDAIVTGELKSKKKETEYLDLPQDNDPMPERPPRPSVLARDNYSNNRS